MTIIKALEKLHKSKEDAHIKNQLNKAISKLRLIDAERMAEVFAARGKNEITVEKGFNQPQIYLSLSDRQTSSIIVLSNVQKEINQAALTLAHWQHHHVFPSKLNTKQ